LPPATVCCSLMTRPTSKGNSSFMMPSMLGAGSR
jgi:hypothetical protein